MQTYDVVAGIFCANRVSVDKYAWFIKNTQFYFPWHRYENLSYKIFSCALKNHVLQKHLPCRFFKGFGILTPFYVLYLLCTVLLVLLFIYYHCTMLFTSKYKTLPLGLKTCLRDETHLQKKNKKSLFRDLTSLYFTYGNMILLCTLTLRSTTSFKTEKANMICYILFVSEPMLMPTIRWTCENHAKDLKC